MRISVNTKPLVDCLARWSWINCPSKTKGQKPTKCRLTKKLDKLNTLFSLMLIRSLTLYRFGSNLNIRCKQAWDKVYNRTLKRKHGHCFTWVWFPHRHDLPWQNWPMEKLVSGGGLSWPSFCHHHPLFTNLLFQPWFMCKQLSLDLIFSFSHKHHLSK